MSSLDPQFDLADVVVSERTTQYGGYLRIDRLLLKHKLIEGGWSSTIRRELQMKDPAVAILLFDPQNQEVVLVRQFRVGMLDENQSPWLLEIVAGMIETGEAPEDVALRESEEEADVSPRNILKICEYYSSPGTTSEKVYLYCGQVDSGSAGGVHGLDSENEDIEVVVVPFADLVAAVENGQVNNAMTIIATQWLEKNMQNVLDSWA